MFSLIVDLWNVVILEPILNLIALLIALIPGHNFGIALILFTVLTRLLLYPLIKKQMQQIKKQKELQPEIAKIKAANKGNRQKEALETMALYKERGFNPFAVLGYLLLQLPIFIGLYQVINKVATNNQVLVNDTYSFVQNLSWIKDLYIDPGVFDPTFLGIVDLTRSVTGEQSFYLGAFVIAAAAAGIQYMVSKQMTAFNEGGVKKKNLKEIFKEQAAGKEVDQAEISAATNRMMIYIIPALIFVFSLGWFAALPFYWFISGLIQYFQQKRVNQSTGGTVKAVVDGKDVGAIFEKPLNAKQKKERFKTGLHGKSAHSSRNSKRVKATVKTIGKDNKKGNK